LASIERTNVAAARAIGITPHVLKVRGPTPDFETAFRAMVSERAEVLAPFAHRERVAESASAHRIPTMFFGGASASGGLMAYGTSFAATYPRMPNAIDKILKGAKLADAPFELISQREFVVNLKTARELGLAIPTEGLKRADRIIE
jgi:putative tryptophan/tyrosine transport system substrate-binding protein